MNRKLTYLLALSAILLLLFGSCGEEGVGPVCINCEYWQEIPSGLARFPDVCPTDWRLIAFSSKRDLAGASKNYHIWVMRLAQSPTDTNRFYQITRGDSNDFHPSWSPDGKWIAFEREIQPSRYQIFAVNVEDLENPGKPFQVTEAVYSNTNPCWVVVNDTTYVAFTNAPVGNVDHDILLVRFAPSGTKPTAIRLTKDPSDYADMEGGVLSAVFHDWQTSSNRSNLIVFSSDSRTKVADIRIEARLQDGTEVNAAIIIRGKNSGKTTPYTFRYRPADQSIDLRCDLGSQYHLQGYCSPFDTIVTSIVPDVENLIDVTMIPTRGTLKVVQLIMPNLVYDVYLDGQKRLKTLEYGHHKAQTVTCLSPGKHIVELRFGVGGKDSLIDVDSNVVITVGQTTEKVFGGTFQSSQISEIGIGNPSQSLVGLFKSTERSVSALGKYTVWAINLGSSASVDDDQIRLIDDSSGSIQNPVITSDGGFVAYIKGSRDDYSIVIADLRGQGSNVTKYTLGLPGSESDIECWRMVESLAWAETDLGLKLIATLSPCGGSGVDGYTVWVADVDKLIK